MGKSKTKRVENYVSKASLRQIKISPQKARLVVDMIRKKNVYEAINILTFCTKKASLAVLKLVQSAVANAENSASVDLDDLFIKEICVDQASSLNRRLPRARGSATPIIKRFSHITVWLDEKV